MISYLTRPIAIGWLAIVSISGLLASCCDPDLEVQKIQASDAVSSDLFGVDVDIWGNYAMVLALMEGNPADFGAIYFFDRTPEGTWKQVQKVSLQPVNDPSEGFAGPVALSLEYAVAGIKSSSSGQYTNGAVLVYKREGNNWSLFQTIEPPVPANHFGHLIDIDGGFLVVGDFDYYGPRHIHVYELDPASTQWTLQQTVVPPLPPAVALSSTLDLAIDGYRMIIGDGIAEVGGEAAYVYAFDSHAGSWSLEQTLVPPDPQHTGSFGGSVAITQVSATEYAALVGDYTHDEEGKNAGAAYFFHRDQMGWKAPQKVIGDQTSERDMFARHVAIDGDFAVVGSWRHDAKAKDAGAAYLYCRKPWGWVGSRLLASDGKESDFFGTQPAIYGSSFIAGAYGLGPYASAPNPAPGPGAAYIYQPPGPEISKEDLVLAPWPYKYIYTGCPIAQQDRPMQVSLSAGHGVELSLEIASPPQHGAIKPGRGGDFSYVPEKGFTGADDFVLGIEDQHGNQNQVALQVLVRARKR